MYTSETFSLIVLSPAVKWSAPEMDQIAVFIILLQYILFDTSQVEISKKIT